MSNLNGLENLGDGFGMEQAQWDYPSIGYNSVDGIFYVGEEQLKELTIVPIAKRECKEVTTAQGTIRRYHPFVKRHDMAEGSVSQRIQVLCWVNDEIHVFGARSWTARALWTNPLNGRFVDEKYMPGLWPKLVEFIKGVKASRGVSTSPYCWRVTLTTGKPFKNPMDQKRMITPIVYGEFDFVGVELASKLKALYEAESIGDWVDEWGKAGGVSVESDDAGEPGAIGAVEDDIDSLPGFDL